MTLNIVLDVSPNLRSLLEKLMATLADFAAKLDKIESDLAAHEAHDASVVDGLNKQIAALQAQLSAGGLTADEEAQVLARLDAIDAKLNPPAPPAA